MIDYKHTINWLKKSRSDAGMSQNDVSYGLGFNDGGQFISNFERGKCKFPDFRLNQLVEVLNGNKEELKKALMKDYKNHIFKIVK